MTSLKKETSTQPSITPHHEKKKFALLQGHSFHVFLILLIYILQIILQEGAAGRRKIHFRKDTAGQ